MSRKGEAQRAVFYPGMKARENGGINNQTQLSPVGTPSKAAPAALGHPSPVPVPPPSSPLELIAITASHQFRHSRSSQHQKERGRRLAAGPRGTRSSPSAQRTGSSPAPMLPSLCWRLAGAEGTSQDHLTRRRAFARLGRLDAPTQQSDCLRLSGISDAKIPGSAQNTWERGAARHPCAAGLHLHTVAPCSRGQTAENCHLFA